MDKSNNLFNKIIKLFFISIILIMLDAFTKAWAESALSDGNINIIKDFFYLSLVHNNGAAFGIACTADTCLAGFNLLNG